MLSNSTKILLLITLVGGVLVSVSSYSWLGAWIGLVINLISFVPLISNVKNWSRWRAVDSTASG